MSDLGRLSPVRARDVWPHEALDFTPWLLKNVDVLSELLGMELVLEAAEHPVGGFSLDLIGRDVTDDSVVIIENQLEQSDHGHLGQIITYAAGTNPGTIVWLADSFRPEHRAAIDWLNERTDEHTRFFGVQIQVVRIGNSEPAPNFRLVAQPNDWEKAVRTLSASTSGAVSERQTAYWDFWELFRTRVLTEHPSWTRSTGSTRSSWFGMSAGVRDVNWLAYFVTGRVSVQIEFVDSDPRVNLARLEMLQQHGEAIETHFGAVLSWEPREGQKGTRLAFYGELADVLDRDKWDEWIEWYIDVLHRLRAAIASVGGIPAETSDVVAPLPPG
jgi:hypothetical protein